MYHQYADKAALFLDVVETVEADVMTRLGAAVLANSPQARRRPCTPRSMPGSTSPPEREIRQLVLVDAPNILGWNGFRDIAERYSLGMTEQLLQAAIDAGELEAQPVRPLAHILIGAMDAAAHDHRQRPDPEASRAGCAGPCTPWSTGCCAAAAEFRPGCAAADECAAAPRRHGTGDRSRRRQATA